MNMVDAGLAVQPEVPILVTVLQIVGSLLGLVGLVCFIIALIKMFKAGDTTTGIIFASYLFAAVLDRSWP